MNSSDSPQSGFAQNIAIQGVGLIGGSIAAALKQNGFSGQVIGVGRNLNRLQEAQKLGLIDQAETDLKRASALADLIIVCTPVDRIIEDVQTAASGAHSGTLISDGGSVKGKICEALAGTLPEGITFIGSHPIAGSEKSGFEHADPDLYRNRVCVVTPEENSPPEQLERLKAFWESLGMNVVQLGAKEHDAALAHTSHLPHLIAATLAGSLSAEHAILTGSGFRDTTRIAAGEPGLWNAIFQENRDGLLHSLDEFLALLEQYRTAIENRDADTLKILLENAKTKRDALK